LNNNQIKIQYDEKAKQAVINLSFVAIFLWPFWIIFDYLFAYNIFNILLITRVFLTITVFVIYYLTKKNKIHYITSEIILFSTAITFIAAGVNIVKPDSVNLYFNAGLFVIVVGFLILFLDKKRIIAYGLWTILSVLIFQYIFNKHSITFLIGNGGVTYFSVLIFVMMYSVVKRKNAIKEITQNILLAKQQKQLLETNNKLKQTISQKELLIKEIHHRVKNNLQIISSLISLQKENLSDNTIKNILQITQNRILSMLIIHEKLYKKENIDSLSIKDYYSDLINSLNKTTPTKNVKITLDIVDISLSINKLIPCGLILNELYANSIKHAFPDNFGKINIKGELNNNMFTITYSDNGIGLPKQYKSNQTDNNTLGFKLIQGLSKQIDGDFKILSAQKGSRFIIEFTV